VWSAKAKVWQADAEQWATTGRWSIYGRKEASQALQPQIHLVHQFIQRLQRLSIRHNGGSPHVIMRDDARTLKHTLAGMERKLVSSPTHCLYQRLNFAQNRPCSTIIARFP